MNIDKKAELVGGIMVTCEHCGCEVHMDLKRVSMCVCGHIKIVRGKFATKDEDMNTFFNNFGSMLGVVYHKEEEQPKALVEGDFVGEDYVITTCNKCHRRVEGVANPNLGKCHVCGSNVSHERFIEDGVNVTYQYFILGLGISYICA